MGIAAVLVVAGAVAEAHHSVAGAYDQNREATVEGVITEFRFVNPHPVITVAESDSGQSWRFDLDNLLEFDAIGFTAGDLKVGDRIVVVGWLARREAKRLYTMRLERPADGFGFEQIANHPQLLAGR
jgi:hypothetical protein